MGIIVSNSTSHLQRGLWRDANLVFGLALTTDVCRAAQQAHSLGSTSCIALGRLLTSAALTGLALPRRGDTSLQVVCNGRLHQIFADVNESGDLRGYVRQTTMNMPPLPGESPSGRRAIAAAIGDGLISVIRINGSGGYGQSSTPLVAGEVDIDVQHFLENSDQVPTVLSCEVLLNDSGEVAHAGGLFIQALPQADMEVFERLRAQISDGAFRQRLLESSSNGLGILKSLVPECEQVENPLPLRWQCRCSAEKVRSALRLLDPVQLAEMVENKETAEVACDFCSRTFHVVPDTIAEIYQDTLRSKALN